MRAAAEHHSERYAKALPKAGITLDDLGNFDAYTHRQSVQVAVLGLLLARRAAKA